jgi:hypothetical protein
VKHSEDGKICHAPMARCHDLVCKKAVRSKPDTDMQQKSKKNRGISDKLSTEASVASVDRTQYLQI